MVAKERIKVLIAKMGIDIHDSGVRVVTSILRDAGMEVVYLGLYNTADHIVKSAIQEDVDVIGISFHEAGYTKAAADLMRRLKKEASRPMVIVGGIIKKEDIPRLGKIGIAKVFLPGSTPSEIVDFIKMNLPSRAS